MGVRLLTTWRATGAARSKNIGLALSLARSPSPEIEHGTPPLVCDHPHRHRNASQRTGASRVSRAMRGSSLKLRGPMCQPRWWHEQQPMHGALHATGKPLPGPLVWRGLAVISSRVALFGLTALCNRRGRNGFVQATPLQQAASRRSFIRPLPLPSVFFAFTSVECPAGGSSPPAGRKS